MKVDEIRIHGKRPVSTLVVEKCTWIDLIQVYVTEMI